MTMGQFGPWRLVCSSGPKSLGHANPSAAWQRRVTLTAERVRLDETRDNYNEQSRAPCSAGQASSARANAPCSSRRHRNGCRA